MQATKADLALYDHIKDSKRRTYAAMVHRLDVNVGRIIGALKEYSLDKNTLVVFISDMGDLLITVPSTPRTTVKRHLIGRRGTCSIYIKLAQNPALWRNLLSHGFIA